MRTRFLRLSWMILLLTFLPASVRAGQIASSNTLRFRFAFGALTGSGQNQRLLRISEDTSLHTGDKIRFMVELQQSGFVYLIYRGSSNSIDLLFPGDLKQTLQNGKRYYVPEGSEWLEFDDKPGMETFYLLASSKRLTSLETILNRYVVAASGAKPAIATELIAEIRKLRSQNLATGQPDRPVTIGGNVRSVDEIPVKGAPDVSTLATDINVTGFYSRTFTIDHR